MLARLLHDIKHTLAVYRQAEADYQGYCSNGPGPDSGQADEYKFRSQVAWHSHLAALLALSDYYRTGG